MSDPYDLTTDEAFDDPYPIFARMLAENPVHRSKSSGGWVVCRYADVLQAARHPALSARRLDPWFDALAPADRAAVEPLERQLNAWSLLSDPPRHTRLRNFLNSALSEEFAAAVRPVMEGIVAQRLAAMATLPEADLVAAYAHPVPAAFIAEMFHIPHEKRGEFYGWCRGEKCLGIFRPEAET